MSRVSTGNSTSASCGCNMGIVASGVDNLHAVLFAAREIVRDEVARSLSELGEKCVARVRDRNSSESWIDRSGNLRSSIGYAMYERGKATILSTFPIVKQGIEGSITGKNLVKDLASLYADTFALVVVAAMSYAEYVESIETKDVLASTELWARSELTSALNKAKARVRSRLKALIK